jgi:hypothetical protein
MNDRNKVTLIIIHSAFSHKSAWPLYGKHSKATHYTAHIHSVSLPSHANVIKPDASSCFMHSVGLIGYS